MMSSFLRFCLVWLYFLAFFQNVGDESLKERVVDY